MSIETTETLDALSATIESDYDAAERFAAMERAAERGELTAATTLRRRAQDARRAERAAARERATVHAVTVDAGHALNLSGALGVVSIVKADGGAELATTARQGYRWEVAPLATVTGSTAVVYPVALTHMNKVRLWQMERQLGEALAAAESAEVGRDANAAPVAERLAYERMARRFAKTMADREPVGDVPADTPEHLVSAIRDVAARRVQTRKTSDTQALKLRKTHRAAMAARKDAKDERAAATADVLIGKRPRVLDLGEQGALLTAREVGELLGRPLTATERKVMQRMAELPAGERAKLRGTDTAAHRLANSLRRK